MKFEISVKNHAELWGQTLYSGDLDRKKFFGLKTPFKLKVKKNDFSNLLINLSQTAQKGGSALLEL